MKAAAGELDPLLWAKKPKSQQAIDLLSAGAKELDARLVEISHRSCAGWRLRRVREAVGEVGWGAVDFDRG